MNLIVAAMASGIEIYAIFFWKNRGHEKRSREITIISFLRSICRGGLAALIGVTGISFSTAQDDDAWDWNGSEER